jgi:uracil-DNA glycosylase family 4
VLVVGLAPGAHGANRTGRVFTGDGSGEFLFRALHRAGFSNQAISVHREDGLVVRDLYITAVCRCAPPGNKPTREEIERCLPYLEDEIALLERLEGYVALGRIAFDAVQNLYRRPSYEAPHFDFAHGATHRLGPGLPWLLASYHPSRQNTQTGRLTEAMFDEVWRMVHRLVKGPDWV